MATTPDPNRALLPMGYELTQSGAAFAAMTLYNLRVSLLLRIGLGAYAVHTALPYYKEFQKYSHDIAESLSQPSIMFKARLGAAHTTYRYTYRYYHTIILTFVFYTCFHRSIRCHKARLNNGREIMVDDYREAYWWLRDNTPQDARVMAWWDYGYQIAGIANRTTIADGNTCR